LHLLPKDLWEGAASEDLAEREFHNQPTLWELSVGPKPLNQPTIWVVLMYFKVVSMQIPSAHSKNDKE